MKDFKAGQFRKQQGYRTFMPNLIHKSWEIDSMKIIQLLSRADRQLGRLDMYSSYVHLDLYSSMHIAKEATQSSKIEGTQTSMEEAFMRKEELAKERRDDWQEVQNYILAMREAMTLLDRLPFSTRLIKRCHGVLMTGVRGQFKRPGEYRKSQNWIGGSAPSNAVFVPPPHQEIAGLMSDLEKFANDSTNFLPDLLKIALIHYQFETIHPFLDGNGRVGRLLITLYLMNQGILKEPILYLSDYLEHHRSQYYDKLMQVRQHDAINDWFIFFLKGIVETAERGIRTFDGILQLEQSLDERFAVLGGRASDARKVVQQLYSNPIIDANGVERVIEKSAVSAYKLIADLEKLGVLEETTGAQRGRLYLFREYLELF